MSNDRDTATEEFRVVRAQETVRARTADTLRAAILNQFYKPGDRLVERKLCELTGVSRTTVREALRQLESEGLVTVIPQRGPMVASLSPEDARELYEMREALEGMAGRLFVERADDDEVAALAAAAERAAVAVRERDVRGTLAAVDAFTDILFAGSRNQLIAATMRTLRARVGYLRATTTHRQSDAQTRKSLRNYKRIVAAVRKRDAAAAAEACVARVRHAAEVAMEMLGNGSIT